MPHCCPQTLAFLVRLGCAHAAAMHEKGAAANPSDWSPRDWLLHMDEERARLWPILRGRWPDEVARLETEHDRFRSELRAFGLIVSLDTLADHSALEDRLVGIIVREGPQAWPAAWFR